MFRGLVLALAVALVVPSSVQAASEERELHAVELDEAVDQFTSLCLTTFPYKSRFDLAARASKWTFAPQPTHDESRDEWRAPHGTAYYIDAGASSPGNALPQCNLDFAIPVGLDRAVIADRIESRLSQVFGSPPARGDKDGFIFWELPFIGRNVVRIYLVQYKDADPRALTLTLQFWDSALLRVAKNLDERGK
jgi:hypothetical protein